MVRDEIGHTQHKHSWVRCDRDEGSERNRKSIPEMNKAVKGKAEAVSMMLSREGHS